MLLVKQSKYVIQSIVTSRVIHIHLYFNKVKIPNTPIRQKSQSEYRRATAVVVSTGRYLLFIHKEHSDIYLPITVARSRVSCIKNLT